MSFTFPTLLLLLLPAVTTLAAPFPRSSATDSPLRLANITYLASQALLGYSQEDLARARATEIAYERRHESQLATLRSPGWDDVAALTTRTPPDALFLSREISSAADEAALDGCTSPREGWKVTFQAGEPRQDIEGILSTTIPTILSPGFKTGHLSYQPWDSRSARAIPLTASVQDDLLGLHLGDALGLSLGGSSHSRRGSAVSSTIAYDLYEDNVAFGQYIGEGTSLAVPRTRNPCNRVNGPHGIVGFGIPSSPKSSSSEAGRPLLTSLSIDGDFSFTPVLHPSQGHVVLNRPPIGLTGTFWSPSSSSNQWALNGSINNQIHFSYLALDLAEEGIIGPAPVVRSLFNLLGLRPEMDKQGRYLVAKVDDCEHGPRIELYLGTNGVVLEGWLSVLKERDGSGDCHLFIKGEDEARQKSQGKAAWRVGWRFNTRFTISYKYPQGAADGDATPMIGISLPPGVKGRRH